MPKIIISESDITSTNISTDISNAVYIPGFSMATVNMNAARDNYTIRVNGVNGVPKGVPKLCTTLNEFKSYFGEYAPTFNIDQAYPVYDDQEVTSGFSSAALVGLTTSNMFDEGDVDPSWVIAHELIREGIPVIYERVNDFTGSVTTGTVDPTPSTEGFVGTFYLNTATPEGEANLFICTNILSDSYVWEFYSDKHYISADFALENNISVPVMYSFLTSAYKMQRTVGEENLLWDRNEYDIKYVTSGGYPVFEYNIIEATTEYNAISADMVALAEGRGDCIALIDHTNNPNRSLTNASSVYEVINGDTYSMNSSFAAMYTPWIVYASTAVTAELPGSFAYLITMAEAVKSTANWLSIAGVVRGVVPGARRLTQRVTNSIANGFVNSIDSGGTCINPITTIRNYGITIWGNRTLTATTPNTEKATYYLNMRSLISEVKKTCYRAAQEFMFEQNSDVLWINFKSKIMPILDEMSTSSGISGYKIIKLDTESKTEVKALIKLYPIYAVETFDITVQLTNEEVSVEE